MLRINFKNGNYVDVSNFNKISYWSSGQFKELDKDKFNEFTIHDPITYNFQGNNKVSIKGTEILYIELTED